MTQSYDFIVIGAGSSGCAIAYRLLENTDAKVLLIEAGGKDTNPTIYSEQVPDVMSLWSNPTVNWGYQTEPQAALNGRSLPIARGKVWGGCSAINAMLHVRGHRFDFDYWNYLGNDGWGYDAVLPYFKAFETFTPGDPTYRGQNGPVNIVPYDRPTPVSQQFFPAAYELGFDDLGRDFDYNGVRQEDSPFYYQSTKTSDRQRVTSASAYIYPILDNPNFTIMSETQVTRLIMENKRVVGVEYVKDGQKAEIKAQHEVILSGGAYESPKLLMLSGIGPAATLQTYGIDVVVDLPGVGQNLQEHMVLAVGYLNKKSQPFDPTLLAEAGLFTRSRSGMEKASPDLQLIFSGSKIVNPAYNKEGLGCSFAIVLIQPQSVGYVSLKSNNPLDVAFLQPQFVSQDTDIQVFLKGIELCRSLAQTKALSDFCGEEIAPRATATSESELREYIRNTVDTLWHPVGTCKMGRDALAVVDPELKVYGVEGLRVADASVMPRIVAGNVNAACVMIAEKVSDLIKKAHGMT